MITGFIIQLFSDFINFIISLLPNGNGLPTGFITSLHQFWNYFNAFNFIFPVDSVFTILAIAIVFELGMLGIKSFFWIVRTVRGG